MRFRPDYPGSRSEIVRVRTDYPGKPDDPYATAGRQSLHGR